MFLAFSYAPFVVGMSKVQKYEHYDKDNNKTVAEKIKFMFTIDHRYIDGAVSAKLIFDVSYFIKAYFYRLKILLPNQNFCLMKITCSRNLIFIDLKNCYNIIIIIL